MANSWLFDQERLEPRDIVSTSMFDYKEYKELLKKCISSSSSINYLVIKVTKLQDDILLFTYAGLKNDDGRASIGIVAMDSVGNLPHAC